MKRQSRYLDANFWIVIAIAAITIVGIVLTYLHVYPTEMLIGPLPVHHWASAIGASTIVIFIPVYSILKRKHPNTYKSLFKLHIYLNLVAFLSISIHFGHHLIDEINPVIDTGTGFLQYIVVTSLVTTGIFRRFQVASGQIKTWRFLHVSLSVAFYLIVISHVLRALRIV